MLDYVKSRLLEAKGKRAQIARESGVPYGTLSNIVEGNVIDPSFSTVQALYNFLKRQEEAAA